MPASFADNLMIHAHKGHACLESVHGPTGLAPVGETGLRLDFWIFQDDAACVGFLSGPFRGDIWAVTPNPDEDHFGEGFHSGQADAFGLLVKEVDNGDNTKRITVERWDRKITLDPPIATT